MGRDRPQRRKHVTEIAEVNTTSPDESAGGRRRKGSGLDSMVLPELKQLASSLGLRGTGAMRKGQLIDAIRSAQNGSGGGSSNEQCLGRALRQRGAEPAGRGAPAGGPAAHRAGRRGVDLDRELHTGGDAPAIQRPRHRHAGQRPADGERCAGGRTGERRNRRTNRDNQRDNQSRDESEPRQSARQPEPGSGPEPGQPDRDNQSRDNQNRDQGNQNRDYDDDGGGRRGRRRRSRDRQNRRGRSGGAAPHGSVRGRTDGVRG